MSFKNCGRQADCNMVKHEQPSGSGNRRGLLEQSRTLWCTQEKPKPFRTSQKTRVDPFGDIPGECQSEGKGSSSSKGGSPKRHKTAEDTKKYTELSDDNTHNTQMYMSERELISYARMLNSGRKQTTFDSETSSKTPTPAASGRDLSPTSRRKKVYFDETETVYDFDEEMIVLDHSDGNKNPTVHMGYKPAGILRKHSRYSDDDEPEEEDSETIYKSPFIREDDAYSHTTEEETEEEAEEDDELSLSYSEDPSVGNVIDFGDGTFAFDSDGLHYVSIILRYSQIGI